MRRHITSCRIRTKSKYFAIITALPVVLLYVRSWSVEEGRLHKLQSSHDGQKENSHQSYKTLIWHVGPPKTATKYLQCALCFPDADRDDMLQQDRLIYLGTCPRVTCRIPPSAPREKYLAHRFGSFFPDLQDGRSEIFRHMGVVPIAESRQQQQQPHTRKVVELAPAFLHQLESAHRDPNSTTAMLIYEGSHRLDAAHLSVISNYLQNHHWNVMIVVSYRRLYDWLPSKYNSVSKTYSYENEWPNTSNNNSKSSLMPATNYQHATEPFALHQRADFSAMVQDIRQLRQHPTETVLRKYQQFFDNVRVWDMHQAPEKNLLRQWFCQFVSNAGCAYDWEKSPGCRRNVNNPSVNLEYDMLAIAAHRAGLLPVAVQRKRVRQQIKARIDVGNHNATYEQIMPRQCWDQTELDELYNLSETVEKNLFEWTDERERQHRLGFQSFKYCSLNVTAALELQFWQQFWPSISP